MIGFARIFLAADNNHMADLPTNHLNQTLSSEILTQSQQLSTSTEKLAQVKVFISQVTQEHILAQVGQQQLKLPANQLQGNLRPGNEYQLSLEVLTTNQGKGLQLVFRSNEDRPEQLPVSSIVLNKSAAIPLKQALLALPQTQSSQQPTRSIELPVTLVKIEDNQLTLTSDNGKSQITLTAKSTPHASGDAVPARLQPGPATLKLHIAAGTDKPNAIQIIQQQQSVSFVASDKALAGIQPHVLQQQVRQHIGVEGTTLLVNRAPLINIPSFAHTESATQIQQWSGTQIKVTLLPEQAIRISAVGATPVQTQSDLGSQIRSPALATLAVNVSQANALKPLFIQAVTNGPTNTPTYPPTELRSQPALQQSQTAAITPNASEPTLTQVTTESTQREIPVPPQQRPQLQESLVNLQRKLMAQAQAPAQAMKQLHRAFNAAEVDDLGESLQQLLRTVQQRLTQHQLQGGEHDTQNLRALLQSPSTFFTPAQTIQPVAAQSGLLEGLLTLLQLSLSARLQRGDNKPNPQALQVLLQQADPKAPAPSPGQQRTLSQWEDKYQVLKQLAGLSASHQLNKSQSTERSSALQEQLYYVLPIGTGNEKRQDVELLIKREHEHTRRQTTDNAERHIWNISMRLPIGADEMMLAKCRLEQSALTLNIYVSDTAAQEKVLNFLPKLKQRLTQLGLEIVHSQCQLGQTQESLQQRSHHIFRTQV